MKKAYRVKIEEISVRSVIVYAEDNYEADQIVNNLWNDGEIVLDADDFVEMNLVSTQEATENEMKFLETVN